MDEIMTPPAMDAAADGPLDAERRAVAAMKKIALMVLGTAMQTYGEKLADEQEVLLAAADIAIDTYGSESALLRAAQAAAPAPGGHQRLEGLHEAAARVYINDAAGRIEASAKTALAAMAEGDTLRTLLAALRRLLKVTPINTIVLRRRLADATVERRTYPF
jgi:UDP-N-acetylmuramoylalanine-D-glutamate ligase